VSALPQGWFEAKDEQGKTYYYNGNQVQWARPTEAAIPAPPPKPQTQEERLQDIIDKCIQISAIPGGPTASIATTPNEKDGPKEEKSRSFPEEKQRKIYENTVNRHHSTFPVYCS
jgi:histone-lysine N-methyltransferase SETD2